ncbi:MAG: TonB-dependent receptor [Pseudomonadota bacterium]
MILAKRALLAPLIFALLASSAQAQNDDGFLGTIILGELLDRTVQDSATSVSISSGEELEARGDVDLYNKVERTPNVATTFGNKGFVIRGFPQNGLGSNGQSNGTLISVQVDGVALNSWQSTFFGPYSTWDLGQVEILRGPQSTQQGRNALAGAVILKTKDPTFVPEYRFRIEGGSRNTQRYALALNQPFSDTVALRFAAEHQTTDGWVTSQPRADDRYDAREYTNYRAKLRWQPNERFDAVLEYSWTESFGGEDYVENVFFPAARISLDDVDAVEGSRHRILGFTTRYDLTDWLTLETETSAYTQEYIRVEGDQPPVDTGDALIQIFGGSDTFEQDVQLKFDTDQAKGVVGVFYTETNDDRPFNVVNNIFPGIFDFRNEQFSTEVTNAAIYGEVDWALDFMAPGLTLTAGARYDWEEFRFVQSVDAGPILNGLGFADVAPRTGTETFDAFLPKLGLTYDFNDRQSASFTVQRAYRAGGVSANPVTNTLSNYDPEFATNYELAYRGSFREDLLNITANAFYTRWEDQQIAVQGPPTGTIGDVFNIDITNAAKSEVWGFELAAQAQPTANLELFGSVGYTNTRFLTFAGFVGNQFPFSPEWTAAVGGKYTWTNGLALGVDMSYQDASFQDNANTYKDDSRFLVNAHATYPVTNTVTAGVFVRNLFDEDYATARFISGPTAIARTGEPRTFGAYLQAEF